MFTRYDWLALRRMPWRKLIAGGYLAFLLTVTIGIGFARVAAAQGLVGSLAIFGLFGSFVAAVVVMARD